ncbi:MAG: hypothetical protein QM758_06905 [Armatimonas sp.]
MNQEQVISRAGLAGLCRRTEVVGLGLRRVVFGVVNTVELARLRFLGPGGKREVRVAPLTY